MAKKKIVFILNPISGTISKAGIPDLIRSNLNHDLFDYEIIHTEYAGHATKIARKASSDGAHIVVAIGGDGTVNEVGRALIGTTTAMAILPCGSGNGLARHLRLPMNIKKCIRIINEDTIKALDYGVINDNPFFCTCGMGFDANVSQKFAHAGKRGPLTYGENMLKEWLHYDGEDCEIEANGETTHHHAFLVTCANASQYGNNAYIAPTANMSDGLLDVIIMKPFNAVEAPRISVEMLNKILDQNPKITTIKCQKVIIHREKPGVIHYDGDPIETDKDIVVEIKPKGIHMVVNPHENEDDQHPNAIQRSTASFFRHMDEMGRSFTHAGKKITSLVKAK